MKRSILLTTAAGFVLASRSMAAVTINLTGSPTSGPPFFTAPGVVVPDGSLIRIGTFATAPAANISFSQAEAAFSEFARTTMGRDSTALPPPDSQGHPVRSNIAGSADPATSPQPDSFFIGKNVYIWVYGSTGQDPTANQGIYSNASRYADQPTAVVTNTRDYINAFGSFAPLGQPGQQDAMAALNTAVTPHQAVSFLLAAATFQGATSFSDSGNTQVDTRGDPPAITVTMHRATADVLENRSETARIDDFLPVKGTNRNTLASQPILPGELNPSHFGGVIAKAGLVADGVTPLLFKFSPQAPPVASTTTYDIEIVQKAGGLFRGGAALTAKLLTLRGAAFVRSSQFTLDAANQNAFAVIEPIDPADIDTGGYYDAFGTAAVICHLVVRDAVTHGEVARYEFGIRKPPIVLVHGYNADAGTWGNDFRTVLNRARGSNFVIRVNYGTENQNWQNTVGELDHLSTLLDAQLRSAVENSQSPDPAVQNSQTGNLDLQKWTFTRYDAVGHSQGGVLLRLLCSSQLSQPTAGGTTEITAFQPFRHSANHFRGRFRRVVTVGSPHGGSTVAHLAIQMQERRVGLPAALSGIEKFTRLLQKKFMIDNGGAGRTKTVQQINRLYVCDSRARIHLLGTTISDSALAYKLLGIIGPSRTASLIPLGADGIVDLRSQCASLSGPSAANTSRIDASRNVAHAGDGIPIIKVFGTSENDTASGFVGNRVVELLELLNEPESVFGSVTLSDAFHATMNDTAFAIDSIVAAMLAEQLQWRQSMMVGPIFLLPSPMQDAPLEAPAPGDQILIYTLDPPPGESPNGPVEWSALVYGPAGVSEAGLSLVTSGTYGEQLALTVAASVQGQVVLSVRFPSTSGKTVLGTPQVALDRPPGELLSSIVLTPAVIQLQAGAEVPLTVSSIYDGSVSSSLFTNPVNTAFQSSNAAVATVDADGRVKLLALGTATITATYNGTLTATAAVTVLDVAPIITSAASVSGTVGQPLSHQIIGSQAVQSFAAAPLPPGLTLNQQTGLVNGTPTSQGATSALVSVTNANGAGSKYVDFVITGPPGAPTDVGLDAAGVNGGRPVGTLVGRLVTVDPNPLDTFTYQLVTGTGSTGNAAFSIAGDQLFTAWVFNGTVTSTVSIRVRTTDSSGASFEKTLVLPVGKPPVIARQPDTREVFVGESAIFFVETIGLEPLRYQWKKDSVDLAGATTRILELPAAALADAGNYMVTVTNDDGTVTSAPASLLVDPISYGRWVSLIPGATSGELFEPMGDYNADGIVNFLEFAFGVQPNLGLGVDALPFMTRDTGGIVLTYREGNRIEPLVYRILKSADLVSWTQHPPAPGDVTRIDRGSYTEVQVHIASPNAGLFVKMNVGTQ